MKSVLSFCKIFKGNFRLIAFFLIVSAVSQAQNRIVGPGGSMLTNRVTDVTKNSSITNKTAATTCPTSPVTLAAQDSTNIVNGTATTIANNSTLACGNQSIIIYASGGSSTNENTPCVSTNYATYYTNIRNQVTETFYEGGTNIGCVGPTGCSFPIGGPAPVLSISGLSTWSVLFGYLDPSQQHDFQFCRGAGGITTTSVTLQDCWTGSTIGGPAQLSNATAGANSTPCFTMSLPAGTDIGNATFTILPASAASALIDYGYGQAQVQTYELPAGTYTVNYSFTPSVSSGCATITGTYKFTVGPAPTLTVTSPTICSGTSTALTATGTSTSYSWSPSTDLSASTGSTVTVTPAGTETIMVTGMKGGCSTSKTLTVTVNPTPTVTANSPSICGGGIDTLKATGATTYTWSPATGLSSANGGTVAVTPTGSVTVYTVTGTSSGCTSSATSTVTAISNPVITVNSGTLCSGNSDTLTASGAATYTWSPATGLSSVNGNTVTASPGVGVTIYTVTGSVGTCSATPATATVTVNATPTVTVNSANLCTTTGGTATLTANGATTYSWTPATGLSATIGSMVVANPTVTTTYTITGTTGSCSSSALSTVGVYSTPTFTVNKATICSGNSVNLIGSDNTLTYTWTPAATSTVSITTDTALVNPLTTTVYTITGANPACPSITITDSVIVNISPYLTVLSPTVCSGTSATITATGAISYTWSPTTNLTQTVTKDTVYVNTPTVNATYTVYGTAANGCTDSAVSNVIVSNHLGILSGTPISVCYGTPFGLSAIGASTYTWTSNDPANLNFGGDTTWAVQASVANVGTYTVAIYGESHSGNFCQGWDTISVTINPTPTVTATNPVETVCNGTPVVLTASAVPNGTLTISYGWFPATGLTPPSTTANTVTATPSVTTVYLATGSYTTGCSANANFTVTVIPVPSFTVNSTAFCLGNSDSLKVGATIAAQNYTWTPATNLTINAQGTAASVNPVAQGVTIYTITGTNTSGTVSCSSTATSSVAVIPLPTVTVAPSSSVCVGSPASIIAAGNAVTYTWTSTSTTFTAVSGALIDLPTTITVYTVTGTGTGGCTKSATTTVTVNQVPTFSINNLNPAFCKGDSSHLSIVPTGTTAATYTWTPATGLNSTSNTTVTATPNNTTTYTVNATATVGGCSFPNVTTVTVHTVAPMSASTATTICNGSSTILVASGSLSSYTWSPASSLSGATNTATVTASPSVSTTYSVTGKDGFGCQSDTAQVTVTVITPTAIATSNSPVCKGQPINLSVNTVSGASYAWSGPNAYSSSTQNPTINNANPVTNSGVYTVTLTAGGCTAISPVNVTVNPLPLVSVSPSTVNVCPNSTISYTATGASTYVWSPSASITGTGSVVAANPSSTTVYAVTGTDANGCTSTATATMNVNPVVAGMNASPETGDAPLSVQFTNLSSNASSYVWNYGNGSTHTTISVADSSTQTVYPTAGIYTVTLVASNTTGGTTCTDTYTLAIIVTEGYSIVVPNVFTPNGDNINDLFTVKSEGVSALSMDIFDRWGLKVFSSSAINAAWDGKTSGGKEMSDGTYFYLINATGSKTGKSQEYKGYVTLIR
jgi:gliding motility-associated-like protein